MVLNGVRGAVGFLTRAPVGHDEEAWDDFRTRPFLFPIVGYAIGVVVALPLFLPVPAETVALLYVAALFAVTGINHADGLADLGDAAVIHGDPEARRAAMRDTTTGVGATVVLVFVIAGLVLAGMALVTLPVRVAFGLIIAAEVSAKLAMAMLACLGDPSHDGLGAQLTGSTVRNLPPAVVVAAPVVILTWPDPSAGVALVAGVLVTLALLRWARRQLGGVSGDVFGASNELARLAALHAGVVVWTLF